MKEFLESVSYKSKKCFPLKEESLYRGGALCIGSCKHCGKYRALRRLLAVPFPLERSRIAEAHGERQAAYVLEGERHDYVVQ